MGPKIVFAQSLIPAPCASFANLTPHFAGAFAGCQLSSFQSRSGRKRDSCLGSFGIDENHGQRSVAFLAGWSLPSNAFVGSTCIPNFPKCSTYVRIQDLTWNFGLCR